MIDSGGFVLSTQPESSWSLDEVAKCVAKIEADVFVSLDLPPHADDCATERKTKIRRSARNFAKLLNGFGDKCIMPVVHGRNLSEIDLSLKLIDKAQPQPKWIGLGGVVPLLQRRQVSDIPNPEAFIIQAVANIQQAFPRSIIHVFGAGGMRTFPAMYALGAHSADSIGWRRAAGFGSIFLPLKSQRVVRWNSHKKPPRKLLDDTDLAQIGACGCPVCMRKTTIEARVKSLKADFHTRSIHNAWTILHQTKFWPKSRSEMFSLLSNGDLGTAWAEAL